MSYKDIKIARKKMYLLSFIKIKFGFMYLCPIVITS